MSLRELAILGTSLVALFAASSASAIDPGRKLGELHHTAWTAREGAPTNVEAIAQTDDGFLWMATGTGLMRFDGVRFERYVPKAGETLPVGPARTLLALPDNGLIVGWFFGGATLLRDGRTTHFDEAGGYPPGATYQFVRDQSGSLWASTSSALARFDGKRWHRVGADWGFGAPRAIALFMDRDGTIGAFTDSSMLILPKGAKSFQQTGGRSATRVPIVQGRDGTYFYSGLKAIRSFTRLGDYDRGDQPAIVAGLQASELRRMIVDRDGGLWFVSGNELRRIARPDRAPQVVEHLVTSELASHGQTIIFEDREGSIWTATPSGVDRFRASIVVPPTGALKVLEPALLAGDRGGLWYAAFGGGLHHATAEGAIRKYGRILATCAYRDPDGAFWFGSQPRAPDVAELLRFENGRFESVSLPPDIGPGLDIQAIVLDASRALWISVIRRGVYRREAGTWSKLADLPDRGDRAAVVMTRDSAGRIWLGYVGERVARWENGVVRVFTASDGISVGNVTAIHERGGRIWIGGDRGLALMQSDRFREITAADEHVLRGITGIVESADGDLWVHSLAGAVLLRAAELRKAIENPPHIVSHRLFDDDDGFQGVHTFIRPLPTLIAGSDQRLWFATNRGAFALDTGGIARNERPPTVVINAAISGGQRHVSPQALKLPALTTGVELDYTTTSLSTPRRVHFRYRLVGVDKDWQDAGTRRQAFYTNLGPGDYRFEVIAANEDGVWNRTGASLDFAIAPAWFQTKVFSALCVLAVLGLMALLYRLRVQQVRSQIQGRLQERLLERERIARELHDTLIQGFQGLVLTLGAAVRRLAPGDARAAMEQALQRAQDMLAQGRDRVRDLRDSVGFDGDLPAALKDAASDLSVSHPAEFALCVSGMPRPLHPLVMEEAYLIAREALANAFQHAAAKRIEVEIVNGESQLRVRIRDDGKGITGEVVDKGVPGHWGMSGMRERAQRLGARLLVRSGQGAGTDVELEIPAKVAYRAEAVVHAD